MPEEDIRAVLTLETVRPLVPTNVLGLLLRSIAGRAQPPVSFVSLSTKNGWFWVDSAYFKSKAALTVPRTL